MPTDNLVAESVLPFTQGALVTAKQRLERVANIPSWLAETAGLFTIHMAVAQDQLSIDGPMLEIGVYKGKYLALLRGLTKHKLIGVQLCEPEYAQAAISEIISNVGAAGGSADPIEIIIADSRTLSSHDLLVASGGPLRLIHIDGSHDAEGVLHDLCISAPLVMEGGLLVLDDAYNFSLPGVTEALHYFFFEQKPKLKPFAHCYNKLFLTTPSHYEPYLAEAYRSLDCAALEGVRERTLRRIAENRAINFVPRMFGCEIVPYL